MKKFSFVLVALGLCISLQATAAVCDPDTYGASCVNQECPTVGLTRLDYGNTGIIACLVGGSTNVWKSMTSDGNPVGTIIAWPSPTLPTDGKWLVCNGQSTTGYPDLQKVVGANVPDYQGYFLRGVGGNSAGLGAAQGDAIRNISGGFMSFDRSYGGGVWGANYVADRWSSYVKSGDSDNWGTYMVFDASRIVPVAPENRPLNKAVLFLIKARQ